ncbi:hypothetical protein D3C85_1439330 [compost metagenome]
MQCPAEENVGGQQPEDQDRDCRARYVGHPPGHHAADLRGKEPCDQLEQPGQRQQRRERQQGDRADLEGVRAGHGLHLHQGPDCVLPFRRAPQEQDRHRQAEHADEGVDDPPRARFRLWQFHVGPQPVP